MRTLPLLLLLAACRPALSIPLDPSLPDGEAVVARPPLEALAILAADGDPGTRALAAAGLILAAAPGALDAPVQAATWDPDPWVQAAAVDALWARSSEPGVLDLLVAYALRASADPYVRAATAHALLDAGHADRLAGLVGAWRDLPATQGVPLALVARRLGDAAAEPALRTALASGSFRDDAAFLAALATWGDAGLAPGLLRAEAVSAEDAVVALAFVRDRLGDGTGRASWRPAVVASPDLGWSLLAIARGLPEPARGEALADVGAAGDRLLAQATALAAHPTAAGVRRALGATDAGLVGLALELVATLPPDQAAPLLAEPLASEDPAVVGPACVAAGRLRSAALVDAVRPHTLADDAQVRAACTAALAVLAP